MWIITDAGFISAVEFRIKKDPKGGKVQLPKALQDPGPDASRNDRRKYARLSKDGFILARARVKEDLEQLRPYFPELEIVAMTAADYKFRAVVPRHAFATWAFNKSWDIDYDSHFKEVVRDRSPETTNRYSAMMSVWGNLNRMGAPETPSWKGKKGGYVSPYGGDFSDDDFLYGGGKDTTSSSNWSTAPRRADGQPLFGSGANARAGAVGSPFGIIGGSGSAAGRHRPNHTGGGEHLGLPGFSSKAPSQNAEDVVMDLADFETAAAATRAELTSADQQKTPQTLAELSDLAMSSNFDSIHVTHTDPEEIFYVWAALAQDFEGTGERVPMGLILSVLQETADEPGMSYETRKTIADEIARLENLNTVDEKTDLTPVVEVAPENTVPPLDSSPASN